MQRDIFLQMCQKASILTEGILRIKNNVPDELLVVWENKKYYPVCYELSFIKGVPTHTAILHELNANCIRRARLEDVEKNK